MSDRAKIEIIKERRKYEEEDLDFIVGIRINGQELSLSGHTDIKVGPGPAEVTLTIFAGTIDFIEPEDSEALNLTEPEYIRVDREYFDKLQETYDPDRELLKSLYTQRYENV